MTAIDAALLGKQTTGCIAYYRRKMSFGVNAGSYVILYFRDRRKRRMGKMSVTEEFAAGIKPGRSYTIEQS